MGQSLSLSTLILSNLAQVSFLTNFEPLQTRPSNSIIAKFISYTSLLFRNLHLLQPVPSFCSSYLSYSVLQSIYLQMNLSQNHLTQPFSSNSLITISVSLYYSKSFIHTALQSMSHTVHSVYQDSQYFQSTYLTFNSTTLTLPLKPSSQIPPFFFLIYTPRPSFLP